MLVVSDWVDGGRLGWTGQSTSIPPLDSGMREGRGEEKINPNTAVVLVGKGSSDQWRSRVAGSISQRTRLFLFKTIGITVQFTAITSDSQR